jgi:serine/threonine protein kinase/tetratricopeptide (TPR) repeat protein
MCDRQDQAHDEDTGAEGTPTAAYGGLAAGPGDQIGPYKLISILGDGGYGIVYLADQHEPVKRRVALKVIKPGMDTRQVIARFEAERQALALLDHPNVAHVYEAGTTSAGRPYFAMEYVKGISIIEHCDRHKLPINDRLELFLEVCDAVQHAHQKGIIHRDLKPSNILVSFDDKRAVPKVIDFGIAKAISQPLTDRTLYTERGQLVGTLEYMSPEQAEMTGQDIDTRSDIYSLGVVLYELLTGVLPFESETLRQGSPDQLRQVIREQDPKTPSTRVSRLTREDSARIAQQRQAEAGALRRRLRGDLDWITLKAMEKDRTHRYSSASELAADIRRHLANEPVAAGPPSRLYRMRKYVRRHRALVTGLAAVSLVFLAGVAGVVVFAVKADRQAHRAQAVIDFLDEDLLGSVALQQAMNEPVTVRSNLDAAAQRLQGRFADQPLIEASIHQMLGRTYVELGVYQQAEPHLQRAYDLRRRLLGDKDLLTLASMSQLGRLYVMAARFKEGEPLLAQALESYRRILGPDRAETLETAVWLGQLHAQVATRPSRDQAEKLLTGTLESGRRLFGEENLIVLEAQYGMAFLRGVIQGRREDAVLLCLGGLETARKALGEGHWLTCKFMVRAAWFEAGDDQFDEAQRLARTVLDRDRRVLGPDHPDTLEAQCTLGLVLARNDLEEAEKLLAPGIERMRHVLGDDYAEVLFFSRCLADVYMAQHRYAEAENLLTPILTAGGRRLGDDHLLVRLGRRCLAEILLRQGRYREAEDLLQRILAARGRTRQDNRLWLPTWTTAYAMQEQREELERCCAQEIDRLQRQLEPNVRAEARIYNILAWFQAMYPSSAIRNGAKAVANATEACKLTDWKSANELDTLAAAYAEVGDFNEAVAQEQKAIAVAQEPKAIGARTRPSEALLPALRYNLKLFQLEHALRESFLTARARQKIAAGQYEAAEEELTAALASAKQYLDPTHPVGPHPETRGCILAFIELYEAWGKPEKAEEWRVQLKPESASPQP